ncbi:MAG: DUF1223 domain-containing protein [Pseudomonadota bacterium]
MRSWALLILFATQPALADVQVLDSGSQRVHLVELFTSEGCSSCPPADRWLREHLDDPALWRDVVPVAFHVDYWDYLGWRDPFARPEHSARQRSYAGQGLASGVYTPGFFVDGEEWRGFFRRQQLNPAPASAPRLVSTIDQDQVHVSLSARGLAQPTAHVAILGFGLQTQVPRGENRGRRLSHDFVVLGLETTRLTVSDGDYQGTLDLPISRRPTQRQAVAVWVSDGTQAPLQAVGGWLNP